MAGAVVLLLAGGVPQSQAGPTYAESGGARKTGLIFASVGTSVFYTPAKFCYAAAASATGGLVLAFSAGSAEDTAGDIVRRGVRGDWWVHPDVFTGHKSLHFVGDPDEW